MSDAKRSEGQCPHNDVHYQLNLASFGDTNIRYLEITAACKICSRPMRFQGVPIGVSPAIPTMAADGSEVRLPVMFGEEVYDGRAIGFTARRAV